MIVVFVLLGLLVVLTPALWAPYERAIWPYVGPLMIGFFDLFTWPVRCVIWLVWPGLPLTGRDIFTGVVPWPSAVVAPFTYIFSFFFWQTLLSRFWKFIGRWDPFGTRIYWGRAHFLKMITGISDWWERETKFGQHATGGFAGLLGVLANEFQYGDIFLGRPKLIVGGMLRPIGIPTQKHFVTIAGTGSGKSTAGLVCNIALHPGNCLILDPKGELAAITARRRGHGGGGVRGMGDDVFVLDPFHIVEGFETASYNVFDEMERVAQYDADRPVSYARKVAQALVPSTSKDPYWDEAPRTFITGLLLHVLQGPKEHRNLVRLRTLIMEGDEETYKKVSKPGDRGDAFDALLVMMENSPDSPYQHVIKGSASSLSTMSHNQRGSVMSMAMEHTSFLDVPEIRKISMKSDFLLEDLKGRNISVYLCLPLNAVTGIEQGWLRMFVMLTVDMFSRINKLPKQPVLLAIDEFPALGRLDGIETVAPQLRAMGVRLWVCCQDIEQLEKVYPESWGGFIGGAEAVQFMGITHPPTVAYIAERLGQHVVVERQNMGQGQIRENASERPLRDPEQIARMLSPSGKNQIIWRGNKRPMLLKLCPYFEYMPWWYYSRDRRFREKWNRWIWRRGSDYNVPPPTITRPPYIPPPKPPGSPPPGEKIHSYLPAVNSYMPEQPADLKPSDNVPGTKTTWGESLNNYMQRMTDEEDRKKREKTGGFKIDPEIADAFRSFKEKPPAELPSQPSPAPASSNGGGALDELDGLIGLDEVKSEVHKTIDLAGLHRERARKKLPDLHPTHHLVFTGNPGTGKTTVARIVGRVYKEIGLLKSGHMVEVDRSGLVGSFVGQTAPKTIEVIEQAMDGVLFIDEAYSLAPADAARDFGQEAVSTLVKAMEDYRDRLVVIVAGYKDEMERFINSNVGLKSRFKTFIEFEDYSSEDLFRIFRHMGAETGIRPSLDAQIAIANLMESLETGTKGFGNGRTVRNIFEECFARQGRRLKEKGRARVDVTVFEAEDIPKVGEKKFW